MPLFCMHRIELHCILYCITQYCIEVYCLILYCILLYCILLIFCVCIFCIVLYCFGRRAARFTLGSHQFLSLSFFQAVRYFLLNDILTVLTQRRWIMSPPHFILASDWHQQKTTTTLFYLHRHPALFTVRTFVTTAQNKFSLNIPTQLRNWPSNSYSRVAYFSRREFVPTKAQCIVGFQLSATTHERGV